MGEFKAAKAEKCQKCKKHHMRDEACPVSK